MTSKTANGFGRRCRVISWRISARAAQARALQEHMTRTAPHGRIGNTKLTSCSRRMARAQPIQKAMGRSLGSERWRPIQGRGSMPRPMRTRSQNAKPTRMSSTGTSLGSSAAQVRCGRGPAIHAHGAEGF